MCVMRAAAEFVGTLMDNVRQRGAMDVPTSDGHRAQISERVNKALQSLIIDDWQSEHLALLLVGTSA